MIPGECRAYSRNASEYRYPMPEEARAYCLSGQVSQLS
jgi:hypothetical protein